MERSASSSVTGADVFGASLTYEGEPVSNYRALNEVLQLPDVAGLGMTRTCAMNSSAIAVIGLPKNREREHSPAHARALHQSRLQMAVELHGARTEGHNSRVQPDLRQVQSSDIGRPTADVYLSFSAQWIQ